MKKILLFTLLLTSLSFTNGCSCNKEIYKFDSVEFEGKTYTCSKSDKKDANVKLMCENFSGFTIELEDDDTMILNFPSQEIKNEEEKYKIENGYLYMKDSGEWMEFAKIDGDKLELSMTGVKVTLKK